MSDYLLAVTPKRTAFEKSGAVRMLDVPLT